ncbi:unnamed protein product [Nyctereutes procyonoides]|uniref:60S ribosomal protein L7a n=1 Tax=Nyctereutes procyonoides TaxID=34880 RepID=A0A811YB35_NYCPR|nr:unnamed protein product [Nyctereutes procyonoides]
MTIHVPEGKKAKRKKVALAPAVVKNQEAKKAINPLQDIQPKRDLTHLVKWPRYIRLLSQRAIHYKLPPVINQFTQALDGQTATQLLKLTHRYKPETKQEKQQRLLALDEKKKAASKGDVPTQRPPVLQAGVNTVTTLVKNKKAQLVVIAHEVGPMELVVLLPALCHQMGFPATLSGEGRAGASVNSKDKEALAKQVGDVRTNDDRCEEICYHWGSIILHPKSVACIAKVKKAKAKELATKLG